MAVTEKADFIRWTAVFIGCGSILLGAAIAAVPYAATHTTPWHYLHQLTAVEWGVVWVALGVLTVAFALLAWGLVLYPMVGTVLLMLGFAVQFVRAALSGSGNAHDVGLISAIVWVLLAGLTWFATLRAAKTPLLRGRP